MTDFRSKATIGIVCVSFVMLLHVTIYDYLHHDGTFRTEAIASLFILATNAFLVYRGGYCHQKPTLFIGLPAALWLLSNLFQKDAFIASFWCYPIIVSCYCMLSERRAWAANIMVLLVAFPYAWTTLNTIHAIRFMATIGAISLFSAIMVSIIDTQRRLLHAQLLQDPLTGLLNRLTFTSRMEKAAERNNNDHIKSSLLAIDIDHFKHLNDTYGHSVGDDVLCEIGNILRNELQLGHSTFRLGGEEFAIIMDGGSNWIASQLAERLRKHIEQTTFKPGLKITISVGTAEHRQGETSESWAKRADDHLYAAKHLGRNRVVAIDRQNASNNQSIEWYPTIDKSSVTP